MPDTRSTRAGDERLLKALHRRDAGRPYAEIAQRLGYQTASAVRGLISKVRAADMEAERG